jgi:hypothetical protein
LSIVKSYINQKTQETNTVFKEGLSPDLFFAEIQLTQNSNAYDAIDFLKELGQKIVEIDDRKYFGSSEISLVNENRYDKVGSFDLGDNVYKSIEEENIEYYKNRFIEILKVEEKDIEYLYRKEFLIQEVPDLDNENIVHVLGTDMQNIDCYYFTYDDKEYFIASINIYDKNNSIHQYIYCVSERKSMTGRIREN